MKSAMPKGMYGKKSKTDQTKKDLWNTKWAAVSDASHLVGNFSIDLASFHHARKAPVCITPEMNSLSIDWASVIPQDTVGWCNPPFSRKFEFLAKAYETAKQSGASVCVMIPCEVTTQWWMEYVYGKASKVFIPDGRYDFVDDDTKVELKGVPFASCFVLFDGDSGVRPTEYIHFVRGIYKKRHGKLLSLESMENVI